MSKVNLLTGKTVEELEGYILEYRRRISHLQPLDPLCEERKRKMENRIKEIEEAITHKIYSVMHINSNLEISFLPSDWRFVYRLENEKENIYFEREDLRDIKEFSSHFDIVFKLYQKSEIDFSKTFVCYMVLGSAQRDPVLKDCYIVQYEGENRVFLSRHDLEDWCYIRKINESDLQVIEANGNV